MKTLAIILIFLSAFNTLSYAQDSNHSKLQKIKKLERLVFASCNKHTKKNLLWNEMKHFNPDLFIWGGDNVYADGKGMAEVLEAYGIQNSQPDYAQFKAHFPIIGIWDDHDYGKNNGGYEFAEKSLSQKYFLDFIMEPQTSLRRYRPGIYASYTFGHSEKVKIILLDNRYFKDNKKGSLLGEEQWQWLEQELASSDIDLFLIVSAISIISPKTIHSEEWADYPQEKERLKKLLTVRGKPYLYLAGDKHFSDIYSRDSELEFLSSGMTHTAEAVVRPLIRQMYPTPVFDRSFGMIDFSWDADMPVLKLSIQTEDRQALNSKTIRWTQSGWLNI